MEKLTEEINKGAALFASGHFEHDKDSSFKGIVNRKRRILSYVESSGPLEDEGGDVYKVKKMRLPEATVQKIERDNLVEDNDRGDMHLLKYYKQGRRSATGASGPLCFTGKIDEGSTENRSSNVEENKNVQLYNTNDETNVNNDTILENFEAKSSFNKTTDDMVSHVQKSFKDHQFADRIRSGMLSNGVKTNAEGPDSCKIGNRMADIYKDSNEAKASIICSTINKHNNQLAEYVNKNKLRQTTDSISQENSSGSTLENKQSHCSGSDQVLVKFRGKIQMMRREDYNLILSTLKRNRAINASKLQANNNISRINEEQKDVPERFRHPFGCKSTRNLHQYSIHDKHPGNICGSTEHVYSPAPPSQAGSVFTNERKVLPSGESLALDLQHVIPDLEKAKEQAQRIFQWHADRYFSNLESY